MERRSTGVATIRDGSTLRSLRTPSATMSALKSERPPAGSSITSTALTSASSIGPAPADAARSSTKRATWRSSGRGCIRRTTRNTAATTATSVSAASRRSAIPWGLKALSAASPPNSAADTAAAPRPAVRSATALNQRRRIAAISARSSSAAEDGWPLIRVPPRIRPPAPPSSGGGRIANSSATLRSAAREDPRVLRAARRDRSSRRIRRH